MNELTIDGKTYVSSKRAAEITGYAKDYVGQLCREGRIEARLVGRNWYVLESSIREHRYGADELPKEVPEESKTLSTASWKSPRYEAEIPEPIPALSQRKEASFAENSDETVKKGEEPNSAIFSDMQSAWQEWFTRKESAEQHEPEATQELVEEAQEVPVAIHALPNEEAIIYEEQEVIEEQAYPEEESGYAIHDPYHSITESTVRSRRNVRKGVNVVLVRSLLFAVSILAIAITAIGTGFSARFNENGQYRIGEIQYLAGVSTYNK